MTRRYAERTGVSTEKSKAEIERTLIRYGACKFASAWSDEKAMIQFEMNNRMVRFTLPVPSKDDPNFLLTPTGRDRSPDAAFREWEQSCRQRWRALALAIKAKLEAVEAGITIFDEEFLAHIVLPTGETVGEFMLPQIDSVYLTGDGPKLLPGFSPE